MDVLKTLYNHRTIRKYVNKRVNPDHVQYIIEMSKRASTSMGLQNYSIIHITDTEIKKYLAEEVCLQPYIQNVPEIFLFIVDLYRNQQILEAKHLDIANINKPDMFFQGFTDACIAAQNMVVSSELMGYGAMFMGSMQNDVARVIKILDLPKLTFPVIGVGFGEKKEEPMFKPRMPIAANVFENRYKYYNDYLSMLESYDEEMKTYYDLRDTTKPLGSFTNQVVEKMQLNISKRNDLFNVIIAQGFDLLI